MVIFHSPSIRPGDDIKPADTAQILHDTEWVAVKVKHDEPFYRVRFPEQACFPAGARKQYEFATEGTAEIQPVIMCHRTIIARERHGRD